MSDGNKTLVRQMVDKAWNGGDMAVIDDLVLPGYVGHDPSVPFEIRGPEGFKAWVGMARSAFPDFHITIEDLVAEDDRVAGRFTMEGTHRGALMGVPPTGRRVRVDGMFIRRIAEGCFIEGWDQADTTGLLQQLGVLPPAT